MQQTASTQTGNLVSRERELARLQEVIREVGAGRSASLMIAGDPGVGKSALLERLVASAEECQVVRAVGVEGEVDLPYSALHQLCRSMVDRISSTLASSRRELMPSLG